MSQPWRQGHRHNYRLAPLHLYTTIDNQCNR